MAHKTRNATTLAIETVRVHFHNVVLLLYFSFISFSQVYLTDDWTCDKMIMIGIWLTTIVLTTIKGEIDIIIWTNNPPCYVPLINVLWIILININSFNVSKSLQQVLENPQIANYQVQYRKKVPAVSLSLSLQP